MSFAASFVSLMDRFDAQWVVLQPDIEVAYPNMDFDPEAHESFVRVTILPGESWQASIPQRRWRNVGVFNVQCFTPLKGGDEPGRALGDSVVTAMRGVTVSGIRLKATRLVRVGVSERWLQHNADTPFMYDDTV